MSRRNLTGPRPIRSAPWPIGLPKRSRWPGAAWERGQVNLTEYLLQQALDLDPNSAAANALRGALQESLREYHAAYQSYRRALSRDRHHALALDGLKRYCERFGLDYQNAAINPAAE